MGEAQQEAMAEPKVEEKKEEVKTEEKPPEEKTEEKPEEKKEEAKPSPESPPPPTVLFVDLHCVGCARKIERAILKCKGVEEVEVDMAQNHVTVKGMVNPEALRSRIQKKTMREAKVLSPLPPTEGEAPKPDTAGPEVNDVPTVELCVNMHCEACAQELRTKILKMRGIASKTSPSRLISYHKSLLLTTSYQTAGVQAVETDTTTKKVKVTGKVSADKLVQFIHRKTGKLAKIIPPPQPAAAEEIKKEEAEIKKPPEEEKKEDTTEKKEEEKPAPPQEQASNAEGGGEKASPAAEEQTKKEGEGDATTVIGVPDDDMAKKLAYWYGGGMINDYAEEMGKMTRMVQWMPVYVVDRPPLPPPPPQIFSDENPNACCIS